MPASAPRSGPSRSLLDPRPLRRAVSQRALVEQAKGILILLYRIDADRAFDVLRDWARTTDATVMTVAQVLVHAVCLEDDSVSGTRWSAATSRPPSGASTRSGSRFPSDPPARPRPRLRT